MIAGVVKVVRFVGDLRRALALEIAARLLYRQAARCTAPDAHPHGAPRDPALELAAINFANVRHGTTKRAWFSEAQQARMYTNLKASRTRLWKAASRYGKAIRGGGRHLRPRYTRTLAHELEAAAMEYAFHAAKRP